MALKNLFTRLRKWRADRLKRKKQRALRKKDPFIYD
jgi:hypothetical protein